MHVIGQIEFEITVTYCHFYITVKAKDFGHFNK